MNHPNTNRISGKVEYCLQKWERCRNSDKSLFATLIYQFYNDKIVQNEDKYLIDLRLIHELPSFESIRRSRQKLNEVGCSTCNEKYEATDTVVRARRSKQTTVSKGIQGNWSEITDIMQ